MGIIGEAKKTMTCIKTKFKTKIRYLKKFFFQKRPVKSTLSTLEKLERYEFKERIHYNDIEPKVNQNQCWLPAEIHQRSKSGPWQNPFFIVLAGQLEYSRHWQGYQRAGAIKAP